MRAHPRNAKGARRALPLLFLVAALTAGAGCAEQPTMILIRGAAVIGSDCTATADPGLFQAQGILDVSLASHYVLFLNVENVAPASDSVGPAQAGGSGTQQTGTVFTGLSVEGNRVLITEVEVGFSSAPGLSSFQLDLGGMALEPSGGKATFPIELINQTQVNTLKGQVAPGAEVAIMASMRFFGITTSDSEVESNEFRYPITVCNGCLAGTACSDSSLESSRCVIPGQDVPFCPASTP